MVNITHKSNTLRQAIATAVVAVSSETTIAAIKNNQVPKGNVFEMSKTAGLFAAKRTSDMIPDCHPLPIEYTHISFEIKDLEIHIFVEVHTIYKTGVEVEAMHAASVVALTLYDMLKPIDKGIEIHNIRLVEKKGGKTDYKEAAEGLTAAVIVCSDSIFAGKKEDKAGKAIITHLERYAIPATYTIIADEIADIQSNIKKSGRRGYFFGTYHRRYRALTSRCYSRSCTPTIRPRNRRYCRNFAKLRTRPYALCYAFTQCGGDYRQYFGDSSSRIYQRCK